MPDIPTRGSNPELSYLQGDNQIANPVTPIAAETTLLAAHNREIFLVTTADKMILDTAATLLADLDETHTDTEKIGWYVTIINNSGGNVTIDATTNTQTLNGSASTDIVLVQYESLTVVFDITSSTYFTVASELTASLTHKGNVELATGAETNTGTDATRAVTPDGLNDWTGSAQVVTVGTVTSGNVTAVVSAASTTLAGKVELATTAETTTGTDATRAVTPDGLKDGYQGSANIATVGTIATGVWSGTAIVVAKGGTGLTAFGTSSIWVPAAAMQPTISNGCSFIAIAQTTAGRPDLQVLDFDDAADEHAQFQVAFPNSWNLGTVTAKFFWTSSATDTDGVTWGIAGVAIADNQAIATVYGAPQVIDDANQGAANEMLVTADTPAITISGSPSNDEMCYFRVFRDVSDANDVMTEDARLIGVRIEYTLDSYSDA